MCGIRKGDTVGYQRLLGKENDAVVTGEVPWKMSASFLNSGIWVFAGASRRMSLSSNVVPTPVNNAIRDQYVSPRRKNKSS